ncbi:iron chelate uptake ABC transporter family permease subunit [Sphingobacterium lactis]|uniref:Iron complex transport system permease protein n=1 Tax=Sphingobacterium lactis TaxID=797291 RepID=A0A1H5YXQ5_9SPHI|nr:iron chelate uptake ABC transporter family permease subunit [Sphingobacterium lactis]SEG28828.1 iron complex transport system permease protein [Sphingobacterium lactis]
MRIKKAILFALVTICLLLFMFYHLDIQNRFIVSGRIERLLAIVLVSVTVGYSTIVFQTLSSNKILTPSLMGYEHLYILVQVLAILFLGSNSLFFQSKTIGFIISCLILLIYSMALYGFIFRKHRKNIYYILLIGLILGIFFSTTTQFLQNIIDPNSFGYVQSAMFATLSKTSLSNLVISMLVTCTTIVYLLRDLKYLNVLVLGRENAFGLGVDYDSIARRQLLGISILVSVSSALVGPITFVGIFVAGMTYRLTNVENHSYNIPFAIGIALILLCCAQFLIEHLLNYKYSMAIIVNLIGALYFIMLILKLTRK